MATTGKVPWRLPSSGGMTAYPSTMLAWKAGTEEVAVIGDARTEPIRAGEMGRVVVEGGGTWDWISERASVTESIG